MERLTHNELKNISGGIFQLVNISDGTVYTGGFGGVPIEGSAKDIMAYARENDLLGQVRPENLGRIV